MSGGSQISSFSRNVCIDLHEEEGETVERHLQGFLERMEPRGVQPIELLHGVMNGMKPLESVILVSRPVQPVTIT